MSYATPYWSWASTGPYYGMPWLNLLGWYVTGLALMGALALLNADRWISEVPARTMTSFYLVCLALPVGINAAAGLWGAVLAAGVTLGVVLLLDRRPSAINRGSGMALWKSTFGAARGSGR
jgi:putative membrane protein